MIPDDTKVYELTIIIPDRGNYEDAWWDYDSEQMVASRAVGVFDSEEHARQAYETELGSREFVGATIMALPWNKIGQGEFIGRL